MRSHRSVFVFVAIVLMASVLLVTPAAGTGHEPPCDPDYVQIHDWPYLVTVLPTGVDDTENLQCALDYGAARPYVKIMLVEGDYYTSFLEAEGFNGVLRGEGRHHTTISTLPDGLDCIARFEAANEVALLNFAASSIVVKGLTLAVGGDTACAEPWQMFEEPDGTLIYDQSMHAFFATTRLSVDDECPGIVDHHTQVYGIGVESEWPNYGDPEVYLNGLYSGVAVAPPFVDIFGGECDATLRGTTIVRSSYFDGTDLAVLIGHPVESDVYIGGRYPWQGNEMHNVGLGVLDDFHSGGKLIVGQNAMTDVHWWGALVANGEHPTEVKIIKNDVHAFDTADGFGVFDFGPVDFGAPMIEPTIGWNRIAIEDTPFTGMAVIGTDGRIVGNKITGSSFAGIVIDGIGFFDESAGEPVVIYPSSGWHVAKNWFPDYDFELADIFLTEFTEANTVECAWWGHVAVDLGVDNELIGCEEVLPMTQADTMSNIRPSLDKALPMKWGAHD